MFLQGLLGLPISGPVEETYSCFCMESIGQLSSFPLIYLLGAEEPFPRFPTGQHHTIDGHFLTPNTGL